MARTLRRSRRPCQHRRESILVDIHPLPARACGNGRNPGRSRRPAIGVAFSSRTARDVPHACVDVVGCGHGDDVEERVGSHHPYDFHGITAVGVVLSCALVWATRRWTGWLAPDVRGLSTNIWATVLALALAKGAYDLLKRAPEAEYLHDRAARSVDPELLVKIRSADCSHTGVLEAIALAEAVERPRWFRRLERCVPGVESTGVMQVKHKGVLTDEESVELFLAKHNEVCEQLANEGATAETIFRRHNNDDNFVAMCRRLQPQW